MEMLVPDPLDALDLMEAFADSYQQAYDQIRQRNVRAGFAIGFAAYLLNPDWAWTFTALLWKLSIVGW